MNLDDVLSRLNGLPEKERASAVEAAVQATAHLRFIPNPGPQTDAYLSQADELFFGGGAGCGKSAMLAGLAVDCHDRSILFRREYPQLKGLIDEVARVLGTRDGYNGHDKLWRLADGRTIEFGAVQYEDDKDKYQGRAHAFKGFDEITGFTESQYRYLIGWTRSSDPKQRTRVVVTGNPPLNAAGQWVIKYWGPWLDPTHPRPARDGELRWYTTEDGVDVEVDGCGPHMIDGREVYAKSRTFIKGTLEDNPYLVASGYAATLDAMPEPMRTMLREGRFDVTFKDADYQVIPTQWIIEAQARWKPDGRDKSIAMTAMGLDIGAGRDETTLAWRYGGWYAPIEFMTGEEARDPAHAAGMVFRNRRDSAPVVVDVGGGFGGASLVLFKENGVATQRFNGADGSTAVSREGKLSFYNKRAEAWWRFREELDPGQDGGSSIALPPDPQLRADLSAPTWKMTTRGVQIESKDEIRARIGRSPDRGDAVVMCLSEGQYAVVRQARKRAGFDRPARANMGYAHIKRR